MPWKKTNEAYFGDSFDRSIITAYNCSVDGAIETNSKAVAIDLQDAVNWSQLNGGSGISVISNVQDITSDIQEIVTNIDSLQKRILALEESMEVKKQKSNLRTQLKTLDYKREII